jgi:hypothetical protein
MRICGTPFGGEWLLPGFGRPPSGHDLRKSRCRRAGDRLVGNVDVPVSFAQSMEDGIDKEQAEQG